MEKDRAMPSPLSTFNLLTDQSVSTINIEPSKSINSLCSCHVCNKVFTSKSILEKHLLIHSGKKPYSCCVCNKRFTQKSNLIVHFRKHTGVFPYKCLDCNKGFDRRKIFEQHQARHHGTKRFTCDVCKKEFARYKDLLSHLPIHTNKKLYVCHYCQKCLANRANLKVHTRIHTNELPYTCSFCCKRFRQNHVLRRHILIHTGERPYCCTTCYKRFSSRSALKNHSLIHLRQFACTTCSASFRDSSALDKHLLLHSGIYPFFCNLCSKGFISNHLLQKHQTVHSNHRPFVCNVCEKRFKYKGNLTMHQLVHSNSAHFVCEKCGRDFVHKNNFKRHLQTHSGERPFVCTICSARFTAKYSLNVHFSRHTNSAPSHKCEICGRCFHTRNTLSYHKLKHLSCIERGNKKNSEKVHQNLKGSDPAKNQSIVQILVPVEPNMNGSQSVLVLKSYSAVDVLSTPSTHKPMSSPHKPICLQKPDFQKNSMEKNVCVKNNETKQRFLKIAPKPAILPSVILSQPKSTVAIEKNFGNKLNLSTLIPSAIPIHASISFLKRPLASVTSSKINKDYKCHSCNKMFKTSKTFQRHRLMHQKGRPHLCTVCDQTFTAKSSLRRHLQRHTGKPLYSCNVCLKAFFQLGNLKVHQQKCSSGKTHESNEITDNIITLSSRGDQNKDLLCDSDEVYVQQDQSKDTISVLNASEEVADDSKPRKWTCEKCNKSFSLWTLLKVHKCLKHAKILPSNGFHPKSDSNAETLNHGQCKSMENFKHSDSQNDETKFTNICQICNRAFSTDRILKKHMLIHTNRKIYKCFCKKRFRSQLSLQGHRLIHAFEPTVS